MATIIGIDYGHKKLGIAVGQTITGTSTPLSVIAQNGEMWRHIDDIFSDWQPKAVVIGKPELADGKTHPLENSIENFIIELKTRYNAEVYRENEAYTSFEARQYQQGKQAYNPVDAHAAAIILESWMRNDNKLAQ